MCRRATRSTGPPTGSAPPSSASPSCASRRRGRPPSLVARDTGHRRRRCRRRRQAPARPLRRRHAPADPPPHDRLVAPVPNAANGGERPAHLLRALVEVPGWVAVCFAAPVVAIEHDRPVRRPPRCRRPPRPRPRRADITDADLDVASERMATLVEPDAEIGAVLLDQRIACGVGNVYKSEVALGLPGVAVRRRRRPRRPTRRRLVATAPKLLRANVAAGGPRTTHARGLAVYGRAGQPCRRCGTPVRRRRAGRARPVDLLVPDLPARPRGRRVERRRRSRDEPKVVVVGAGFGGWRSPAASPGTAVDVTLVDRNNFHTFLPLLYQVASAGLERRRRRLRRARHRAPPAQRHLPAGHRHRRRLGAHGIVAPRRRRAELPVRPPRRSPPAPTAEYFGIPGAAEHALPLYSLADAVASCATTSSPASRPPTPIPPLIDDGALTFVVVGGGPTGVEMAGALSELFDGRAPPRLPAPRHQPGAGAPRRDGSGPAADVRAAEPGRRRGRPSSAAASRCARTPTVAAVEPTRVLLRRRRAAAGAHAHLGRRRAGQPARRRPRRGDRPRRPHRRRARPPHPWPSRGLRHRRHRPHRRRHRSRRCPASPRSPSSAGRHVAGEILRALAGADAAAPFRYHDKGSMATIGRRRGRRRDPAARPGRPCYACTARSGGSRGWGCTCCT